LIWEKCFFLWCPDSEKFAMDYASEGGQGKAVVLENSLPYFGTAHTSFSIYPYAQQWSFVGGAPVDGTRGVRSAEAFVTVTEDDVLLKDADGNLPGSFLHTWQTAANTDRLDLQGSVDHSPRLQVGRVILQRESWKLQLDASLIEAAKTGGETAFASWRKFRAEHKLPESVYLRGAMSERFSLDKDAKPIYFDFRNPLLTEVVNKMALRFEKLWVTEMLPKVEDCWLHNEKGHYSWEFRTVVMASRESRAEA
jgi:lantibiotic biosynthesis dehydratase-like protein